VRVLDSRRLTGPSLLLDRPGAILEVRTVGLDVERAIDRWRFHARRYLDGMGWPGEQLAHRVYPGGMQLAFTAPIDVLYLATNVNEWAWVTAAQDLGDAGVTPFESNVGTLRARTADEASPALLALAAAAEARGLAFLSDDKRVSVGLGAGSRTWPRSKLPASPDRVRWTDLHDVPVALVTGTNGKTTTVRLLGAMARAAGRVAGVTSTDRVDVGEETVAVGDYSGPNGGRTVLRDRRVELAFLEVARGGILRRGLPLMRADAALVTNVANDHLGEFGIFDVDALADAKLVVAKAVGPAGRVVLNADDPRLLERGLALDRPVTWFTLDPGHATVREHRARGGEAVVLEDDTLVLYRGNQRHAVARLDEVPIAVGGAARHNVANALGAIAVAAALALPDAAIVAGLRAFDSSPEDNPGRANQWDLNGLRVIVDFAHNPHGIEALAAMASAVPATRLGIVIGQAGDRDDDSIADFARAAWSMRPDRVFIKEMTKYLRGREPGAITEIIELELLRSGAAGGILTRHDTEIEAVRAALAWARPGDLLLLTVHADRDAVIDLVVTLERSRWSAGEPLIGAS
jgi:UDP-N-acetylmuramyl tripeptide synthase